MTEGGTPESSEDPFVVAVRAYIMDTLTPLMPTGDQTGRFMHGLLRRALKSASKNDLEQVVLHCVSFTDGLRANGFITEELARQATSSLNLNLGGGDVTDTDTDTDTTDWSALQGQGAADWTDEEWQEHSGETPHSLVSEGHEGGDAQGVGASTDSGGGHETEMAGDHHTNGEIHTEAVPEDGAG